MSGKNEMPELSFKLPSDVASKTKEIVFVLEDVDVPLPFPGLHTVCYNISPSKGGFKHREIPNKTPSKEELEKLDFKIGPNMLW